MGGQVQSGQFRQLLNEARRHTRRAEEAEDLLQDAFVAALAAGRADLSQPDNMRWMRGVLRHRSAFLARSAVRRRQRESVFLSQQPTASEPVAPNDISRQVQLLPPALRTTFLLAVNGQTHGEIRHLLSVSEVALRQRICEIRKRLRAAELSDMGPERLSQQLSFGAIRRSLRPLVLRLGAQFATHDPDGHLICFGHDLTKLRLAATTRR